MAASGGQPATGFKVRRRLGVVARHGVGPSMGGLAHRRRLGRLGAASACGLLPATQNVTLISRTRNVTNIGVSGGRAVNRSFDVATAEHLTRSRVQRVNVADAPRQIQVPRTQGNDQQWLDSFLRDERQHLQTQQADEMRAAQRSQDRAELQRRHQAENKAFEQHAAREQQQMKQHGRPSYESFDRTTVQSSPATPANGNTGQGKDNKGQGASNKGHGKSG
jgi:hypothetical protein